MKARHKRLAYLAVGLAILAAAAVLVFQALGSNMSYFFSPTEVVEGKAPRNHVIRIGGLVKPGTLQRGQALTVTFVVTDNAHDVTVRYTGILPDLFAEGQGAIAQGRLNADGVFIADEVLAKHDENYMPPEVAEALEKGHEKGKAQMMEAQQP